MFLLRKHTFISPVSLLTRWKQNSSDFCDFPGLLSETLKAGTLLIPNDHLCVRFAGNTEGKLEDLIPERGKKECFFCCCWGRGGPCWSGGFFGLIILQELVLYSRFRGQFDALNEAVCVFVFGPHVDRRAIVSTQQTETSKVSKVLTEGKLTSDNLNDV